MTHSHRERESLMLSNLKNAARHGDKIMKVIIVCRVAGGSVVCGATASSG